MCMKIAFILLLILVFIVLSLKKLNIVSLFFLLSMLLFIVYLDSVFPLLRFELKGDEVISINLNDNSSYYIENDEIFIDVIVYNEKIKKEIENEEKDIIDDNNDKEEINDKIENKDGEELIDKPNKIEKLPDLGIINHVNYLIFFLLGYKRVKKNNC